MGIKKIMGGAGIIALSAFIAMTIVDAKEVQEYKIKKQMFGVVAGQFCVNKDDCVTIHQEEELPVSTDFPLDKTTFSNHVEVTCLARNITQEAQRGNKKDMIAIAWATVNRVKIGRQTDGKYYPKTICGVISQSAYSDKHKKTIHQMYWYGNTTKRASPPSKQAVDIARGVLSGQIKNPSTECMITNWYNKLLDPKGTYNEKMLFDIKTCPYGLPNMVHMYIGIPVS